MKEFLLVYFFVLIAYAAFSLGYVKGRSKGFDELREAREEAAKERLLRKLGGTEE